MSKKRVVFEEELHNPLVSKLCAKTSQLSLQGKGKNMGRPTGRQVKPRGFDDPGRKRGKSAKQESAPMAAGAAGEAAAERTKKPRNTVGDSAGTCGTPCREEADRLLLQLRIAAWQDTFPDYLPTHLELARASSDDYWAAGAGGVRRRRWHSSDYIAHLTEEELRSAPRRARGRLTLEAMNALVDHFNEILAKKYRLLDTPRAQVASEECRLFSSYLNQQTAETKHWRFLTEDDLQRPGSFDPRRSAPGFFEVMRQCGRTCEILYGVDLIRCYVVL